MAGLDLRTSARAQATYGNASPPTTAAQAAFGSAIDVAPGASAFSLGETSGVALWAGVAGLVLLVAIYYSLPG